MTFYVSDGVNSYTPTAVDGFESSRESATIVHQILGRSNPDITIRPAGLRTGTLRLVFADSSSSGGGLYVDEDGYIVEEGPVTVVGETDSKACEDAHAAGGVMSLYSTALVSILMTYVANGSIRRSLSANRAYWILEVDYHEVQI